MIRLRNLYWPVLFLSLCLLTCCSSDMEVEVEEETDDTEYYVQYDVSCVYNRGYGLKDQPGNVDIRCNGGGINVSKVTDYIWGIVVGPFKKGEIVTLSVNTSAPLGYSYTITGKISVSKEFGPYVTCVSLTDKHSVSMSYTIED